MKPAGLIKKYQSREIHDDGVCNSQEFLQFSRDFRSTVKNIAAEIGGKLEKFSTGHYEVSGFISKEGKYVYFSYNEPRHMPLDLLRQDCSFGILVRKAKNNGDYRGGSNHFCNILNMKGVVENLLC